MKSHSQSVPGVKLGPAPHAFHTNSNRIYLNLLRSEEGGREGSPGEDVQSGDLLLVDQSARRAPKPHGVVRLVLEPTYHSGQIAPGAVPVKFARHRVIHPRYRLALVGVDELDARVGSTTTNQKKVLDE